MSFDAILCSSELAFFDEAGTTLKVPKCEIFDRYPIKSLWEDDFGVKIKCFKKNI